MLKEVIFLARRRFLSVLLVSTILGALIAFGANLVNIRPVNAQEGDEEVALGAGKRKVIEVDRQRVVFPHKFHQKMVLAIAGGEKEMACKICHHKKRKGRDPRACRRCHAGKMQKAKGVDLCLTGCHVKRNRTDLVEILKQLPRKKARKGQLIKLKDAFHLRCKNCHAVFRALNLDLDSTKYLAPTEYCEGCHVPKSEADREKVKSKREAEKKRTGDTVEAIKTFIKEGGPQY
jgi:Zn finger protein HypA/HybF involved in hydrogenase expression